MLMTDRRLKRSDETIRARAADARSVDLDTRLVLGFHGFSPLLQLPYLNATCIFPAPVAHAGLYGVLKSTMHFAFKASVRSLPWEGCSAPSQSKLAAKPTGHMPSAWDSPVAHFIKSTSSSASISMRVQPKPRSKKNGATDRVQPKSRSKTTGATDHSQYLASDVGKRIIRAAAPHVLVPHEFDRPYR